MPCRFFFLLVWFPKTNTGLNDHFLLNLKMKVQFQKWQGTGLQYVPGKNAKDSERGFGKGARMIQHWAPLDYEDITLISLVIRMIATICLTHPIDDSIMPVWGFLSSRLFFTDLNSFWMCYRAWEIIRNSLVSPSWSYIIDLIDLVLYSSFLKFLLRNDLLPAFLKLLIKYNSSCWGATNLL